MEETTHQYEVLNLTAEDFDCLESVSEVYFRPWENDDKIDDSASDSNSSSDGSKLDENEEVEFSHLEIHVFKNQRVQNFYS